GEALSICRAESWGAEFYAVAPAAEDRVVIKHRYDAFFGTDLDLILRTRQVDTVILTGVTTNVCVESTARQAFFHGYRLVLAADLMAALLPEEHAASLHTLETYFDAATADAGTIAHVLSARNRRGDDAARA
ncbi:MAG: cysteine hydrolase family protein, partial [Stellaceae bacterium]